MPKAISRISIIHPEAVALASACFADAVQSRTVRADARTQYRYGRMLLLTRSGTSPLAPPSAVDELSDLCVACYQGDMHEVHRLLGLGAAVDGTARSGHVRGYTPLTVACGFTSTAEVAAVLLQGGASSNLANHYGRTPLMAAVINSNAAAAKLLLAHGAALEQRHKNGMTAIDYARLAVAESANTAGQDAALETAAVLVRWRARRRLRALARHARIAAIARCFERHLLVALDEVLYRPGGRGAQRSRDSFEALAAAQ